MGVMKAKEALEFVHIMQRIEDDRVRYFLTMLADAIANSDSHMAAGNRYDKTKAADAPRA